MKLEKCSTLSGALPFTYIVHNAYAVEYTCICKYHIVLFVIFEYTLKWMDLGSQIAPSSRGQGGQTMTMSNMAIHANSPIKIGL